MSTLRTDGAGSNGVHDYRRLLTDHLAFVNQIAGWHRFEVGGVQAEDVAAEIVLWLLQQERYWRAEMVFEKWVLFAAKRVVGILRKTRGWASTAKKRVFRSRGTPRVVNATEPDLHAITDRPADDQTEPPACRRRVRKAILALKPIYRRAVLVKHWLNPSNLSEYDRAAGNKVDATACKVSRAHQQLRALLAG